MSVRTNMQKAESKASSLLECFAEAPAYICPSGQICKKLRAKHQACLNALPKHQRIYVLRANIAIGDTIAAIVCVPLAIGAENVKKALHLQFR